MKILIYPEKYQCRLRAASSKKVKKKKCLSFTRFKNPDADFTFTASQALRTGFILAVNPPKIGLQMTYTHYLKFKCTFIFRCDGWAEEALIIGFRFANINPIM